MVAIQTTSKIKKTLTRVGAFGAVSAFAATGGMVAFGGTANAQTMDGAAHQGGDAGHEQHKDGSTKGYDRNSNGGEWGAWEPSQYKEDHGADYGQWRDQMMQIVGGMGSQWESDNSNPNWTPEGENWQSDWGNWDPEMWQKHGSSYENWRDHMVGYMNKSDLSIQIEYMTTTTYTTTTAYKANIKASDATTFLTAASSSSKGEQY